MRKGQEHVYDKRNTVMVVIVKLYISQFMVVLLTPFGLLAPKCFKILKLFGSQYFDNERTK
jgi:hypothetical protein